jgi:ribosomal protein L30E
MKEVIIGTREIIRGIEQGKVKKVLIASNAPSEIKEKLNKLSEEKGVKIELFDGDELKLATKHGKPFPVACVGYTDEE